MLKKKYIKLIFVLLIIFTPISLNATSLSKLYEKSFKAESSGDYKSALNYAIEILKKDQNDYYINLRTGWLFYLNQDYLNSEKYYERARSIKPDSVEPLIGMILPLMVEKRWEKVIKIADAVIKIDPCNYLARIRKAFACNSKGEYRKALEIYRSLLNLYPANKDVKLGLGWVYINIGNKKEAAFFFKEVLKVSDKNVSALSGMNIVSEM